MTDRLAGVWSSLAGGPRLGTPELVKGLADELGAGEADVREILGGLSGEAAVDRAAAVRCFAARRLDRELGREVGRRPPAPREPLAAWADALFGESEFMLVVNGAERWARRVVPAVARALEPSYAYLERRRVTLELVLLIGRYRSTPFGIHQDPPGTNVLHLHLGPGRKRLTLFDPAEYAVAIAEATIHRRAHALALRARTFEIAPGDGFFLPATYVHVGASPQLSAAIACKYIVSPGVAPAFEEPSAL